MIDYNDFADYSQYKRLRLSLNASSVTLNHIKKNFPYLKTYFIMKQYRYLYTK